MQTDKIKLIVEHVGEGMKYGITKNHLHVSSNIDKMKGLRDILEGALKTFPPNSEVDNIVFIYHFMAFIKLHTSSRAATMLLFDPEQNEATALEFYENIVHDEDDTPELRDHFMQVFYKVCEHRDEYAGTVELVLGDGGDDAGNFSQISDN